MTNKIRLIGLEKIKTAGKTDHNKQRSQRSRRQSVTPCDRERRGVAFRVVACTHVGAVNRCRYSARRDATPRGAGCLTPGRENFHRPSGLGYAATTSAFVAFVIFVYCDDPSLRRENQRTPVTTKNARFRTSGQSVPVFSTDRPKQPQSMLKPRTMALSKAILLFHPLGVVSIDSAVLFFE
jgi:hypothetical protein